MSFIIQIFIVVLCIVSMLSIVWSTLRYGISPMPSNRKASRAMLSLIPKGHGHPFIDLGSGWGQFAYQLAKQHPDTIVIGYERSLLPYFFSLLIYRRPNLSFRFKDFTKEELPQNAVFFCYLYPKGMDKLGKQIKKIPFELISNTFALTGYTPISTRSIQDLNNGTAYYYQNTL